MSVFYASVVVWLVTQIIVESEVFRPLRERITHARLRYLVNCHLCSGVWVGWVTALIVPGPLPGKFVLNGLLYKGLAHILLEVTALIKRSNVV